MWSKLRNSKYRFLMTSHFGTLLSRKRKSCSNPGYRNKGEKALRRAYLLLNKRLLLREETECPAKKADQDILLGKKSESYCLYGYLAGTRRTTRSFRSTN